MLKVLDSGFYKTPGGLRLVVALLMAIAFAGVLLLSSSFAANAETGFGCGECTDQASEGSGNEPVIWQDSQAAPKALNDLIDPAFGWYLEQVTEINNKGENESEIVGKGTINDETHAFLLKPDGLISRASISPAR